MENFGQCVLRREFSEKSQLLLEQGPSSSIHTINYQGGGGTRQGTYEWNGACCLLIVEDL